MTSVSNARKLATWHAIVLISDASIVTIMDMLQQIALTKYHLQAHWHNAETTPLVDMTDQHLRIIATPGIPTMTIETGTDSVDLNLAHITPDIGVTVVVILTEAILDHFTSPHAIAHSCHRSSSTYCYCHDTPHHRSSSCRHFSRDDSRSRTHKSNRHHYKPANKDHLPVHNQHPGSPRIEGPNRLQLMIHPQNIIALMNRTVIQRMI